MDTRSKKTKSEDGFELEIMRAKLAEQQLQLQEREHTLKLQRKQFERERNESVQLLDEKRRLTQQKELESRQLQESEDAFKAKIVRELG